MIEYKDISSSDYSGLKDTSGAYRIIIPEREIHWAVDEKFHRIDGPAVEVMQGAYVTYRSKNKWFVNDVEYFNAKDFQAAAKLSDEDILAIVLKYGDIK